MIKTINNVPAMPQRLSLLLFTLANLLIPIAILVFAIGFFPYKPFIPGKATFEGSNNGGHSAPAPFDKVIFMVVDALRRLILILRQRSLVALKHSAISCIPMARASNSPRRELSVYRILCL